MSATVFPGVLARLAEGKRLSREESRRAMHSIMEGKVTPAQIGAFLLALRVRGETAEEIAGAAESMRAHAVRIQSSRTPLLDTCGTGGDGTGTFNISTAAAFVVAGAGVPVAKHGNRSVSSKCGSADVLEALGAKVDLSPAGTEACLEATGVGFLFAPRHHGAMKHAAGVRKELAIRTLFNLLGPLCNPAGATHQLMGVYDPKKTETLVRVLWMLGSEGAMVVHGDGGLDEISLSGPTRVSEWRDGAVRTYRIAPESFGMKTAGLDSIRGGDAAENAGIIRQLFTDRTGPPADIVVLNAGAALYICGAEKSLKRGMKAARASLDSGKAREALDAFVKFTRDWNDG